MWFLFPVQGTVLQSLAALTETLKYQRPIVLPKVLVQIFLFHFVAIYLILCSLRVTLYILLIKGRPLRVEGLTGVCAYQGQKQAITSSS